MKKINYFAFFCVALICIGLLVSGNYCVGVLNAVAYTAAETFTRGETTTSASMNDTLDTIDDVFSELGLDNALVITDIIRYLSQDGNTFSQWVYENYGESVELPESVKGMSTSEVIMYVLSRQFNNGSETTTSLADAGYTSLTTQAPTQQTAVQTTVNGYQTTNNAVAETTTRLSGNTATYITGDVNFDTKISAADARLALRVSASLEILSAAAFSAADVNGDGIVTAKDARSILRYSAGLTQGF